MSQIRPYSRRPSRRQGFTLIEILIAVGLFLVLLAIILVPLNQAFKVFNVGRTSIALQNAADTTVKTIAADLRGAVVVFPNDELPGITDRAPYKNPLYALTPANACPGAGCSNAPYMIDLDPNSTGDSSDSCANRRKFRVGNSARVDFLLPVRNSNDGSVVSPVKPEIYVVSYFTQRQKAIKEPSESFEEYENPIAVYRAKTLYQKSDGDPKTGLNTTNTRYGSGGCDSDWLRQIPATTKAQASATGGPPYRAAEAQIPTDADTDERSMVTPRDTAVSTRFVFDPAFPNNINRATMQPDLNFACEDSDGNGVIDRVTISLTLVQYEDAGSDGKVTGQRVTATQIVNLSNARFGV